MVILLEAPQIERKKTFLFIYLRRELAPCLA